jgi:uncharacterized protein YndB with AHSA1/START domain
MNLNVRELVIQAPARTVYELFADTALLVLWMATTAELDPVPGGVLRWRHANGDVCVGRFVELVPYTRLVFTYGWERAEVGIPPGSTTVEVDLVERDGATALRLTHSGLADAMADAHATGWSHCLNRLKSSAEGHAPGPDPWADQAVPTPAQLAAATDEPLLQSPEECFWSLAEPLQARLGVTRSTMMGFPCLRVDGRFFAAFDRRTQHLVVKLTADRVEELIETGCGAAFAPNGRRFREWVAMPPAASASWQAILVEACTFVRASDTEELQSGTRRQTGDR